MSSETLPPHARLIEMVLAQWGARFLHVAAKLGLADHLANAPKTAEAIAGATGLHPPALYRFMRALASLGIFSENGSHQFSLTPLGEALRRDAPGGARATILTLGADWWGKGFDELPYSLATGKSGFEKALGMPIFDWLAQHPDAAALFSETMVGVHGAEPPAVAAAYDFAAVKTIADIGGGTGNLLSTILAAHSGPQGILFDMPHVVKDAPAMLAARGVADRVKIAPGSFFDTIPGGADIYLMSHIIHDWSEVQCLAILGNCKAAMEPSSRLLLIEMVLPVGDAPHPGKMLDVMMLVGPGGEERTEAQYASLLGKAGFKLVRVLPTASPVSIVEAVMA